MLPAATSSSRGAPSCQAGLGIHLSKSQQMPGGSSWPLSYPKGAPAADTFASAGTPSPDNCQSSCKSSSSSSGELDEDKNPTSLDWKRGSERLLPSKGFRSTPTRYRLERTARKDNHWPGSEQPYNFKPLLKATAISIAGDMSYVPSWSD